jgi:hypothetical protein
LFTGTDRSGGRGRPTTDDDRPTWTAWRLLSRNNRELGRSPDRYRSTQACVAAVERLRSVAGEASRVLSVDDRDGRWCWRLMADGVPVAVSSRSYHRQRECLYSLDHFMTAVTQAEPPVLMRELPPRARAPHPPVTTRGAKPHPAQNAVAARTGPLRPVVGRPPAERPISPRWLLRTQPGAVPAVAS